MEDNRHYKTNTIKERILKKLFDFLTNKRYADSDLEVAKALFQDAGLAFPTLPEKLALNLKERDRWVFSTRRVWVSPYNLQKYVKELNIYPVRDYAILSHSGYGSNSYAIQYYLVYGNLKMFLYLGWGGTYMDRKNDSTQIKTCFALADKIVQLAQTSDKLQKGDKLKIVCSDFRGSYWSAPNIEANYDDTSSIKPEEVLTEVLDWLQR